MIVPSKSLISFIDSFESKKKFCDKFGIDQTTLSKYLDERVSCSSKFIESIKGAGIDFEKAFEIKE